MRLPACRIAAVLSLAACASPPPAAAPGEASHEAVLVESAPPLPEPVAAPQPADSASTPAADASREILFDYRSARVPKEALPLLDEIAQALKGDRLRHVTLIAQADSLGSREFSVAMAGQRAAAVEAELLKRGVRAAQIRKRPLGNVKTPRGGCAAEACRQKMRRVELQLSAQDRR